jgi:hypothetical protein
MDRMVKPRMDRRVLILPPLCFALILSIGCARQHSSHSVDETLPFHAGSQSFQNDPGRPALPTSLNPQATSPFRASSPARTFAPGTLLTVQLGRSLAANKVHAGDAFRATLLSPLNIDGSTVVPTGTHVLGHIESTRLQLDPSKPLGYFQLSLDSITIDGRDLPLQTSSLFARASVRTSGSSQGKIFQIKKGHHLTFRLTSALALDDRPPSPSSPRIVASASVQ